ncbi:hypothetical protein H257_18434 [Aphanomyces astaci]|uniref:C2H2-type domain-containing protein n=1 Tax=Aphanomyces astaci TaxID=112090 RepID=W4FDC5_APHAT|nr:hypothetical protein H257_18434 [Aphanomyces astaci]ETV64718.1 hypothetical protein H257_18434 [Aphanomyces astaci]|eukprot:XP_009845790.1 hypothetical protein H257_18434 [Aphanomyces astaci]
MGDAIASSGDGIDRGSSSRRRRGIGVPSKWGVFGPLSEMHAGVLKSSMRPSSRTTPASGATASRRTTTTNRTINLPARSFSFRQRRGKLDTRAIAQIDLNRVVRETDIDTIQNQLENLAFSDITLQDFNQYSDEYFLKLFQIAQLTVEYLLNVQESLVMHTEELESQCEQVQHDCAALADENESVDAELRLLKQEIKQKQNTISTYELMLLTRQHQAPPVPPPSQGHLPPSTLPPVECILCNKKFLSTEYLIKHQRHKHVGGATQSQVTSPAPTTVVQVVAAEPSPPPPVATPPATPDLTVVNALISANTAILTQQIEAIHVQLAHDKSERATETQLWTQQHQSFENKMMEHMARMQEALKDMHVQAQAQRNEWTHFTHDVLQKAADKVVVATTSNVSPHIGAMVHDGADDQWRHDMLHQLKAQHDMDSQHRQDQLDQERQRWNDREAQLLAQLNDQKNQQLPTLTQLVALEAHKYGIDYGFASAPTRDHHVTCLSQIIQTDPNVCDSQQQTDEVVQGPSRAVAQELLPPPTVKVEESPPLPLPPPATLPAAGRPVDEERRPLKPAKELAPIETSPLQPTLSQGAPTTVPTRQHQEAAAATTVQKVAAGFLTRKHLSTPENWLLRHGHIEVPITPHMTANDLRRVLAQKLGDVDPHRIILHHRPSGSELVGDVLVFYTHGLVDVEVIPDHPLLLDKLVDTFNARTSHIQTLRKTLPRDDGSSSISTTMRDVGGGVVQLQALVRGMLSRRRVTELRIDRLVDLRLKQLHDHSSTDEDAVAHHLRYIPRRESSEIQGEAVRVQARLVQAMATFHPSSSSSQTTMSQAAFDMAMLKINEARKLQPAPVQGRMASLLDAIHTAAMEHYDPAQAKADEIEADAAVSIQAMVRMGLAKKLVAQLAKTAAQKKEEKNHQLDPFIQLDANPVAAESKQVGHEQTDNVDPQKTGEGVALDDEVDAKEVEEEEQDGAITIDDFNKLEDRPMSAQLTAALARTHYEEEKASLHALHAVASSRLISPHSNTQLKSMQRRSSRGTMLHNAR